MQLDRADIGEGWNVRPAGKAQAGAERPEELGLPGQGTSPGRRPSLQVKAGVGGAGKRRVPATHSRHTGDARGRGQDCLGGSQLHRKLTESLKKRGC